MTRLTIKAAAERVDRSERTIYRWIDRDLLTIRNGTVAELDLLKADRTQRQRKGRPRIVASARQSGKLAALADETAVRSGLSAEVCRGLFAAGWNYTEHGDEPARWMRPNQSGK
ncbi:MULTISPECIES: helix-turn-helix domain-containing protein [unclassified Cryobacterium]|uniref:helix-turn-helix domain-containing protein n=1 Tax=unclassified Cryobacterium TaxID=2649013 RepID=UPI002AB36040|nr:MULTISPECIES: helix-turn-helix domain-containing protein [unclassified Cryobacterium]MDY7528465.1 hypothetical protein [Cryobacterium sp. 10C2]MDY7555790.1 hypothetical protein [Cryobacterium sp. 10C3]MEB0289185.1 hypothetical protein [Cryobacterium sp. 10C2]